jgi:flagellar biosynthesis GTPase FlhF
MMQVPDTLITVERGFFSDPVLYCFFGYPGSGIVKVMVDIVLHNQLLGASAPEFICCDEYTIAKEEQIRVYAEIVKCTYSAKSYLNIANFNRKKAFVYLRGFNNPSEYAVYDTLFAETDVRKVLVIDCSRDLKINTKLIGGFKTGCIDGVVLTRLDMQPEIEGIVNELARLHLPLVFATESDKLPGKSIYSENEALSQNHYTFLRTWS